MTRAIRMVSLAAIAGLTACASQPEPPSGDVPGFFTGLLHGALFLISMIGSVFFDIRVYAFPNSGFWYDAGFVFGVLWWGAPYAHRVWSDSSNEGEAGLVGPSRHGPLTGGRPASANRSVDADRS